MSTNQLLPIWIVQDGDMSADIATDPVGMSWEDNIAIQVVWTGTPTGVLEVQVSLDPSALGWQTVPFSPTPTQPAGSAGSDWYDVNQTAAAYVRLIYTAASGAGTLKAKLALKSV